MIVPCDTSVDIILNFGGTNFAIPPRSYVLGPVNQGVDSTEGTCMSGFSSGSDGKQSLLDRSAHDSYVEQDSG